LLGETNARIVQTALQALTLLGPAAAEKLSPVLSSKDPTVRRNAFQLASQLGPQQMRKAMPQLIEGLKDSDVTIRQRSLQIVSQLGPEARDAVPTLIDILKDEKIEGFRSQAAQALSRIGPDAKTALPQLQEAARDGKPQLRLRAAEAIGFIQPDDQSSLPILLDLIRASKAGPAGVPLTQVVDVLVRQQVEFRLILPALEDYRKARTDAASSVALASMLLQYYPGQPAALPLIQELLKDQNQNVRNEAAFALCRYGNEGKNAVAILVELLKFNNAANRVRVLQGCELLGSTAREAVPVLLERWRTEGDQNIRLQFAGSILAIDREQGKPVLEWLQSQMPQSSPFPNQVVLGLLCRHDATNAEVHAALERMLHDRILFYQTQALELTGLLGAEAKPFVPTLKNTLKDANVAKRVRAAYALWRIEGKAEEVMPVLVAALQEPDAVVRNSPAVIRTRAAAALAANYLGEMGPAARSALPALREAEFLGDAALTFQAQSAIRKVGKK
jgi:HEAT repeat protein